MKTLYECHGHIFMDGMDYRAALRLHKKRPDEDTVRAHLAALKDAGVGFFRDGGDPCGVSLLARELAPEYGITYRTPAFAIHRADRYGGIVGMAYGSMGEYRALIRRAKEEKADFIKLMFSGLLDFNIYGELSCPPLPAGEIKELVHIAHGEGFAVMAHVNGRETVLAAVEAGTDSVEHGYLMDEDCTTALAESGTVWVPTLAAIKAFAHRDGFSPQVVERLLENQYEMLRLAARRGGVIAAGSDSGAVGVPHGAGILRERELLKNALGTGWENILLRGDRLIESIFQEGQGRSFSL